MHRFEEEEWRLFPADEDQDGEAEAGEATEESERVAIAIVETHARRSIDCWETGPIVLLALWCLYSLACDARDALGPLLGG